jgi:putative PIN family toxin of toxin-antitoxin system
MVRAVFDTVIFVWCLLNPRSHWGTLIFERVGSYPLVVSPSVLSEIIEVLDRPVLARSFRFVAGRDKRTVLALLSRAEVVAFADVPAVSRDRQDDKFRATAKAGSADYLVTEDNDLLVIGEHEGMRIADALTFLRILDEAATPRA